MVKAKFTCEYCKETFIQKTKTQKYCKKDCYKKAKRIKEIEAYCIAKYGSSRRLCMICTNPITKFGFGYACSQKCRDELDERNRIRREKKPCKHCGNDITAPRYSNAHKFLYSQFLGILVPWSSHLCVNHCLLHSEQHLYTFNIFFSHKFVN